MKRNEEGVETANGGPYVIVVDYDKVKRDEEGAEAANGGPYVIVVDYDKVKAK